MDIGAVTPFLWCFRDRDHILNLLEWVSGARMLYNYIWIGGLFYDLPVGFEERCLEFITYFRPKLSELNNLITTNYIFTERTVGIGILPLSTALNYGVTGPMLRASGLAWDIRRVEPYSVYPEIDFDIPIGSDQFGKTGDCWNRFKVRVDEIAESLKIAEQCCEVLIKKHIRTTDFDPRALCPKKIRPQAQHFYVRAENPKGELGYFFVADGKSDKPYRCKARTPSFSNLSVLPEISRGVLLPDLIAILGSIDIVLGEVDR
jgi:NADH-quinone oxidoreductase subunit D